MIAREAPPEPQPPAEQERVATLSQPSASGTAAPEKPASSSANEGSTPSPDYLLQIRALLEENKQYPPMAQRYGMEGEVLLWFVLDRQGHVLDYHIDQSSGNAMLDQEVERLIQEISQFPPVPPEVGTDKLELLVPVSFRLAG